MKKLSLLRIINEEKSVYNRSIESTLTDIEVLSFAAHVYVLKAGVMLKVRD